MKGTLTLLAFVLVFNTSYSSSENATQEVIFDYDDGLSEHNVTLDEDVVSLDGNPTATDVEEVVLNANATSAANETQAASNVTSKPTPRRVICMTKYSQNGQNGQNDGVEVPEEGSASDVTQNQPEGTTESSVEDAGPTIIVIPDSEDDFQPVRLVNGSYFLKLLSDQVDSEVVNRSTPAQCSLVFFYASWCPFSAKAAAHFNAMPRLFPDLNMFAVDTYKYHGINTHFGIMALPTVILFHNSKGVGKFNLTDFKVAAFAKYVTALTGIRPSSEPALEEEDHLGPIPTKEVPVPNYYLALAWIFTLACAAWYLWRSPLVQTLVEAVRKTWQEAEQHHEHED